MLYNDRARERERRFQVVVVGFCVIVLGLVGMVGLLLKLAGG